MPGRELSVERTIAVRALANQWISDNFPTGRRHLSHSAPVEGKDGNCHVDLLAWSGRKSMLVGKLVINEESAHLAKGTTITGIGKVLGDVKPRKIVRKEELKPQSGRYYDFVFGDGIKGVEGYSDKSIDLLLTDPPYGISAAYGCESQVPRRLRKDGRDFIMPKGHFGDWDKQFPQPHEWTDVVLPKIKGWAVIFCAHGQIGEYEQILRKHKFVAVGAMVWQKTNPVPFNHTFKPVNAWEAIMVGKRSGTKFNWHNVHNVFCYKSPSPQHRVHPTQKPLDLVVEFVRLFSSPGAFVFDPFGGGGTTLIAAAKEKRHVVSFENDADVFYAASKRIADAGLSE